MREEQTDFIQERTFSTAAAKLRHTSGFYAKAMLCKFMPFIPGGNRRDRPGSTDSCFTIVIQSRHRRTEKEKNRSSDIFEDTLPMINAAFFFMSRLSSGPCEHKTRDT